MKGMETNHFLHDFNAKRTFRIL